MTWTKQTFQWRRSDRRNAGRIRPWCMHAYFRLFDLSYVVFVHSRFFSLYFPVFAVAGPPRLKAVVNLCFETWQRPREHLKLPSIGNLTRNICGVGGSRFKTRHVVSPKSGPAGLSRCHPGGASGQVTGPRPLGAELPAGAGPAVVAGRAGGAAHRADLARVRWRGGGGRKSVPIQSNEASPAVLEYCCL